MSVGCHKGNRKISISWIKVGRMEDHIPRIKLQVKKVKRGGAGTWNWYQDHSHFAMIYRQNPKWRRRRRRGRLWWDMCRPLDALIYGRLKLKKERKMTGTLLFIHSIIRHYVVELLTAPLNEPYELNLPLWVIKRETTKTDGEWRYSSTYS
jgi:hypothetical protein